MKSETSAATVVSPAPGAAISGPWWRSLIRYHWFVFMVACLAWLFDCLDQQLFLLARNGAMKSLLPAGADVKLYGGYATTIFVAGGGTGGLLFRAGRGPLRPPEAPALSRPPSSPFPRASRFS